MCMMMDCVSSEVFPRTIEHPPQQGAFPPAVSARHPPACIWQKAPGDVIFYLHFSSIFQEHPRPPEPHIL